VHTSTFDVFHAETGGTVSESAVAEYSKGTAYERSKQHAEELVLAEAERGIEVVIVNPSSVYGPGPWQSAGLDRAFRDAIRRRLPGIPPGGMTLVHADDVATGQLAAFERGKPGERYILADGYATMRELLSVAVEEAGGQRDGPGVGHERVAAQDLAQAGDGLAQVLLRLNVEMGAPEEIGESLAGPALGRASEQRDEAAQLPPPQVHHPGRADDLERSQQPDGEAGHVSTAITRGFPELRHHRPARVLQREIVPEPNADRQSACHAFFTRLNPDVSRQQLVSRGMKGTLTA
jgi:hypothetical protein